MLEPLKYPKEYTEGEVGFIKDPFRPEFKYDSRGRLVMPLPGYSKLMLAVEPGSKRIGQSSEDEAGNPQTEPGSLKTGYLNVQTQIKCGPEAGWVVVLAGGDADRPIQYGNETTEVVNFYVDKEGNVYLKGTIVAVAGGTIGAWTIGTTELYAGSGAARVGLRPGTYPFYAGHETPASAPFRVNAAGQIWCTSIELLEGAGVGDLATLDQVDTAQIVDAAIEEAQLADLAISEGKIQDAAVAWAKLEDEAVHADKVWQGGEVITLSAQIKDAIILNAHIDSLAASKITAQIVDAQIANIGWAKILNVAIVNADIVNLSADKINAGVLTGRVFRTSALNNFRLELRSGTVANAHYIAWYDSSNNIKAFLISDPSGNLVISADGGIGFLAGTNFSFDQNIVMGSGKTVDGVDISVLGNSVVDHVADVSAHHNKYSDGLAITPSSVDSGSGTITTLGWIQGGYLYGKTAVASYKIADINVADKFDMYVPLIFYMKAYPDPSGATGKFYFNTTEGRFRGYDGSNFRDICFYDERNDASPIPTFVSGLEQLKKIKAPTMLDIGLCFNTPAFPKEFKIKRGKKQQEHIDLKPVIGMLIKSQKELLEKVEKLENKL